MSEVKELMFWDPANPTDRCFINADQTTEQLGEIIVMQAEQGRIEWRLVRTELPEIEEG